MTNSPIDTIEGYIKGSSHPLKSKEQALAELQKLRDSVPDGVMDAIKTEELNCAETDDLWQKERYQHEVKYGRESDETLIKASKALHDFVGGSDE